MLQNDESQSEIAMAVLEDVIMEVISSNRKKPSIPGIILETIIDLVNGVVDVEAEVPSENSPVVASDVLAPITLSIVEDIVDEVVLSNNRQPSVAGVVLQLITEMITHSDTNNNQQTNKKASQTATAAQDGVNVLQKQKAEDKKVKKLEPSEAQKQKDSVRPEPMAKVCNYCSE